MSPNAGVVLLLFAVAVYSTADTAIGYFLKEEKHETQ